MGTGLHVKRMFGRRFAPNIGEKHMKESLKSMLDVSSTMLITLYARARESKSKNPIINDHKAKEMINTIKKEIVESANQIHEMILKDRYNKKLSVSMSLRSRRFDKYATDFMHMHPKGTVLNLGCGLDTRFDRIDNGTINWFDIDFGEVIELRKKFMEETERRHFISESILDPVWTKQITTKGPYLILAEGVFMYLTENEVKKLLTMIHEEFGKAELVCEVTNKYWVDKMKSNYMQWKFKHQLGMTGGAVFTFGIPDGNYFEEWNSNFKFIDEWTYFDDREPKMGWSNMFSNLEKLRKVQWTIHYSI